MTLPKTAAVPSIDSSSPARSMARPIHLPGSVMAIEANAPTSSTVTCCKTVPGDRGVGRMPVLSGSRM